MSDIVDKVSMAIMIEDRCGCTITGTGERVLCDDDQLGGYRQKKCNCRDEAKAAIRATLEFYRDNPTDAMIFEACRVAHAGDSPAETVSLIIKAAITGELDDVKKDD